MADDPLALLTAGDTFSISGLYGYERNPRRRWWAFWRPRWVEMNELRCFKVMGDRRQWGHA